MRDRSGQSREQARVISVSHARRIHLGGHEQNPSRLSLWRASGRSAHHTAADPVTGPAEVRSGPRVSESIEGSPPRMVSGTAPGQPGPGGCGARLRGAPGTCRIRAPVSESTQSAAGREPSTRQATRTPVEPESCRNQVPGESTSLTRKFKFRPTRGRLRVHVGGRQRSNVVHCRRPNLRLLG